MGGGISFSDDVSWRKAGWAYRAALDGICRALAMIPAGKELYDELSDAFGAARTVNYINFRKKGWSDQKRLIFLQAIQQACSDFQEHGPRGWHDPSFFPAFLDAFKELRDIASVFEKKISDSAENRNMA